MRLVIGGVAAMVVCILAAYGGYRYALRTEGADRARVAAVNTERLVRVRKSLSGNEAAQARNLLDVGISQELFYMQSFDLFASSDAAYLRQRGRSVSTVKAAWLETPPFAIEDGTKIYIDQICSQQKDCRSGEIHAKPQSESEMKK